MGTIGVEVNQRPQADEHLLRDDALTSTGWKLQSLNNAATSLLRSGTRLENEMDKETRYWEEILVVKENGWSVCRLPTDKHTLSVRYGFAEGKATCCWLCGNY
jgi:mediator of RNA polymerase II transcription subunit 17